MTSDSDTLQVFLQLKRALEERALKRGREEQEQEAGQLRLTSAHVTRVHARAVGQRPRACHTQPRLSGESAVPLERAREEQEQVHRWFSQHPMNVLGIGC